ncbi:MAG: potassium transporter Trk [Aurantimicrobium sp.]|nr:potassium transporter Trk [Aurantimicrobium sp.]
MVDMATPKNSVTSETVTVRRSPRYLRFFILGLIVGVIAALVLTVVFPIDAQYTVLQVFGFMLLISLSLGGALGLVVAIILDRTVGKRTITTQATRETVGNPEA